MACLLNGNTIEYWVVKQTGPCDGVPTTPVWTNLRRVDGTLERVPTFAKSAETDPTRQAGENVLTQQSVEGSFNGEFPIADSGLRILMESALQNTFGNDAGVAAATTISFDNASSELRDSANGFTDIVAGQFIGVFGTAGGTNDGVHFVSSKTNDGVLVLSTAPTDEAAGASITITGSHLRNNANEVGLSVQKRTTHEAGTEFLTFSDVQVNTLSFAIESASLLTTTYAVLGRQLESGTTQIAGATDNALSTSRIVGSVSGVPAVWIDGTRSSTDGLLYTNMTVDIDNGAAQNYKVGGSSSAGLSFGAITCSGQLNSYVDKTDGTSIALERTKADAETKFDIAIEFTDANGHVLVIRRPSTMYTSFNQPESGNGTVVQNTGSVDSDGKGSAGYTVSIDYIPNPNA
jgi:hypothetical protein